MKNIESAKIAIDLEINFLENQLKICQKIKADLTTLCEGIEAPISVEGLGENTFASKIDQKEFSDYPFDKKLFERLTYLDKKFPKAWKMRERRELMIQIEGPETRERFKHMSGDLKNFVNSGLYIGAKYNNDNKSQFYCRREWISDDGKSIKPEYAPTDEDFGTMPVYKRRNELIVWMTGR